MSSATRSDAHNAIRARTTNQTVMAIAVLLLGVHLLNAPFGSRVDSVLRGDPEQARLRLNPNTASAAELRLLPSVGPKTAANIIEFRDGVGARRAFERAEDLDQVTRIGPLTVEKLRPHLRFD